MRKLHSPEFKAQVVQELHREQKSVTQLAAECGVHPNQVHRLREVVMAGLPSMFSGRTFEAQAAKDAAHAQEVHELHAQIGELNVHLAWLKISLAEQLSREVRMALIERGSAAPWLLTI